MKNTVTYSIIIPHYNSIETLIRLIESIPVKKDIEIIVVDDNSKDDIKRKLKELKDIQLYFNTTGIQSAGVCRNIGIDKSHGKWLIFADADDYFEKNCFSIINNYIENISKEIEMIYFPPNAINTVTKRKSNRGSKQRKLIFSYLNHPSTENEIRLRYNFQTPWSKVIRKSLVLRNNIKYEATIVSNDVMFSFFTGKFSKKVMVVNKAIYCVTENATGLTVNKNIEREKIRAQVLIRFYKQLNEEEKKIIGISWLPFLIFRLRKYKLQEVSGVVSLFIDAKIPLFKYIFFNKLLNLRSWRRK